MADPASVSPCHPRWQRQEQFCFYPMEKVPTALCFTTTVSLEAKAIPCITSLWERLILCVFVS